MKSLSFQLNHPRYSAKRARLRALVAQACRAALAHEGVASASLSVVLAEDETVRSLNHDFRGKNKATNVLAFPSDEKDYLGDIIVSLDTTAQEAKAQGKTFDDHLSHLLVHACLHLLGHDHMKKTDAKVMEAKEINVLKELGIANPYA